MVATAAQMKELDRQAIEEYGIPSLDLMERAALGVAGAVWSLVGREDEEEGVIGGADGPIAVLVGGADRKEAQKRLDDAIADDPAQGIAKQIIHVKQPITAWINEVQPAELGQLKEQGEQERIQHTLAEAAAKVITQVDAEGDGHHDVEQHLKQRTVMQQRKERKWLIRRCFFHDVHKKMKRDQLCGRPAHQFDLLHGGQWQDHEKICAQQIQYKRIDDQDPHGKH